MQIAPECPYCSNDSELVDGLAIYPHRKDLAHKKFYLCRPCKAYVGCHPNTIEPLGRLANAELRDAKMRAHAVFDPYWMSRTMARVHAYRLLAKNLRISTDACHIGMFDLATCNKVVEICTKGLN